MPDHKISPSYLTVLSIMIGIEAAVFAALGIITTVVFGCWITLGFFALVLLTLFLLSPGTLTRRQGNLAPQRPRSRFFYAVAALVLIVLALVFALISSLFAGIFISFSASFFGYTVISFVSLLVYAISHIGS